MRVETNEVMQMFVWCVWEWKEQHSGRMWRCKEKLQSSVKGREPLCGVMDDWLWFCCDIFWSYCQNQINVWLLSLLVSHYKTMGSRGHVIRTWLHGLTRSSNNGKHGWCWGILLLRGNRLHGRQKYKRYVYNHLFIKCTSWIYWVKLYIQQLVPTLQPHG